MTNPDSFWKRPKTSPSVLAAQDSQLNQLADNDLREALRLADKEGPVVKRFELGLIELGLGSLISMYESGGLKWKRGKHVFSIDSGSLPASFDERQSLFSEVVMKAVRKFMEECIYGERWKPDRGASLNTFFIGRCLLYLHDHQKRYYRSRGPGRIREELTADVTDTVPARNQVDILRQRQYAEPESRAVARDLIERELASVDANARDKTIYVRKHANLVDQQEIANEFGVSVRTVSRALAEVQRQLDERHGLIGMPPS